MSMETWKAEFYPVAAEDCAKDDLSMIDHALLKWSGLSKENLNRHGLGAACHGEIYFSDDEGRYLDGFLVGGNSCALCLSYSYSQGLSPCDKCPLKLVRDGFSCDRSHDEGSESPWESFTSDNDERPMIKLLEDARVMTLMRYTK